MRTVVVCILGATLLFAGASKLLGAGHARVDATVTDTAAPPHLATQGSGESAVPRPSVLESIDIVPWPTRVRAPSVTLRTALEAGALRRCRPWRPAHPTVPTDEPA
ncbi:MAG: hypothetical protein R3A78_14025 [Polyangiales bacterium]|nr:hypothetical protein [Myxococcales bacterium]